MKVLSFGSLNIDNTYTVPHFVSRGETLSSLDMKVFTGGKGLNQSVALARAGASVYHAGAIGNDGLFLLDELKASGVNTDHVLVRDDIKTGHAIIQNNVDGDNCILLFGGANQSITREQADVVISQFAAGDYLVLQNEINELSYIMERADKQGMIIVLNPSPMNEKILSLPLDLVDIFMVNEVEGGQILGKELSDDFSGADMAKALLARFPEARIVLTMGSRGSMYIDKEICVSQNIYKVKAVDTTAAGDTFTGYFIAGLIEGLPMKETMDRASRASAITVTRKGAAPSIPTKDEVEAREF